MTLGEYAAMFPNPQRGPCGGCGAENYNLSMGGPGICPACDCLPPPQRVRQLAEENRLLRQQIAELQAMPLGHALDRTGRVRELQVEYEDDE